MAENPYAAPQAALDDVRAADASDLERRKSGRGKRLGAWLIDVMINVLCLVVLTADQWRRVSGTGLMAVIGLLLLLIVAVVNGVLVYRFGQTLGKRALGIAMVRTDGDRMGLARYIFIRSLPVVAVGLIPFVGRLAMLGDALAIFGTQKRCVHDLIADTIVVDV